MHDQQIISKKVTIALVILNLISSFLFSDERLRLKKADILESKVIENQSVKLLSGNVIFSKGNLTLYCQEGRYFEKSDIALLYRNVSAVQDGRTLTCDTLKFISKEDKLFGIGDINVFDNEYNLKSDSLLLFTEKDSGRAIGNVILNQKGQTIYADKIEYKKSPQEDGISYTAFGNVVIKDSSKIAKCEIATYLIDNEMTILSVNPSIEDSEQILTGEKIILTYQDETLKEIKIPKSAKALTKIYGYRNSKIDSISDLDTLILENSITGSSLNSSFKNGKLNSIRIRGMARTLYHVFEDSIYKGKNKASGDSIIMTFSENILDHIEVYGGSEGQYIPDSISNDIKSNINYSSDKITYMLNTRVTNFKGNTDIQFEDTNLKAGYVSVNWKTSILNALPKEASDTTKISLNPTIIEPGRDPMTGNEMLYNLKTKKGKITKGSTKADDGFYTGSQIRNESEKVFLIQNSTYTTCDLDTAHFHFESTKMKIIQNDMVIAKPIVLYIANIPILGIPFGIFPHKGGQRHSGWIMPSYGDNKNRGQYIQGLGFYWAPSDYWDSKLLTGFGDKQGITFKINTLYRVRYKFNGNINFFNRQYLSNSKNITTLNDNKNKSTSIKWVHKQELRNNQSLNANVTYSTSGDYNRNFGLTERQRMDQKAVSNISYSKRWPKAKNSISINIYSNRDLLSEQKVDPDSRFYVTPNREGNHLNYEIRNLPKFSFRHGQSDLFPTGSTKKRWYNTINWNYGLNFNDQTKTYYESVQNDSLQYIWDEGNLKTRKNSVWIHNSRINAPQKIFKYIALNPSLNLKSAWVNRYKTGEFIDSTRTFKEIEQNNYAFRTTGSFSLSSNTQIYGIIPIPFGNIKAIRHVISPSISYSWTPDFSKPLFGKNLNYFSVANDDSSGEIYYFDKYKGSLAGGTPRSEQKAINLGLNNVFQAKVEKDSSENKVDLLNWKLNTSYNFAADSLNLSNLRSSLRSKLAKKVNLDVSLTHDFYEYNTQTNRRTRHLIKNSDGLMMPRLISARFSTSFKISGDKWSPEISKEITEDLDSLDTSIDIEENKFTDGNLLQSKSMRAKQLWTTNFNISYSQSANNPDNISKNFWMNTNSSIRLTEKWKASYRARFDLIEKELTNHSISIYRDLHCWELSLNWTPTGYGQGVNFKLNVKSPTLQDIKVEKKGGIYSGAGL